MTLDELLHENEWLSLYRRDGWYVFSRETRSKGNLVAILVYRKDSNTPILGRYEITPCHGDGMVLTTITGGVDHNMDILQALEAELWEEAGYPLDEERVTTLGSVRPSKSADTTMHYYAFDATGLERRENSIGDGTKGEEGAYCDWVSREDAVWAKDPHMAVMIMRLNDAHL